MRRGSGINKGADPEGCAQHESTQPLTLLPIKRSPNSRASTQQIQDLRGGSGGAGILQGASSSWRVQGEGGVQGG